VKNYVDRGDCYPPRLTAEMDNILRDLHNSSIMRKPHSIIVLLFIRNIWPILGPVSGYKNWMIFLADISQKVGNIHRANVLRILAKPFLSLL